MRGEVILKGVPIVSGKAYGKAFFIGRVVNTIEKKSISAQEVGNQIILLNKVREQAKQFYREYQRQYQNSEDLSWDSSILDVYTYILDDPTFIGQIIETITTQLVTLETAVHIVSNDFIKRFSAAQTSYFKERGSDMVEICEKLISLINTSKNKETFSEPVILIIPRTFIPSDLLLYDLSMVKGVIALNAGATSHAVILSRSYEIPVVSGIQNIKKNIIPNSLIYIDAQQGTICVNPDKSRLKEFESYQLIYESIRLLSNKWKRPVYTKDGNHIKILANVSLPGDIEHAHQYGADGVGLVRSEYLLYLHNDIPNEKEQQEYFEKLFIMAKGMHLTIRLFDIGADKVPSFIELPKEMNPSLGWRGIRILLKQKDLFRNHVSAIMKAAGSRHYSIMIPMVSTVREWREAHAFIQETADDLNVPVPKCGVLFEVPLALLEIDSYLNEIDFISIGTNDLIQYLFAADRNNPNVNYLYNPVEPAFLHLLKRAIDAGKNKGKSVSICGEMAGLPLYTILLVGLGLTHFSVSSHTIPGIKEIISHISYSLAHEQINHLMTLGLPEEMNSFLLNMVKKVLGGSFHDLEYLFDTKGLSLFCADK